MSIEFKYAGRKYRIDGDGDVRLWDSVAGHYSHTLARAELSPRQISRARTIGRELSAGRDVRGVA